MHGWHDAIMVGLPCCRNFDMLLNVLPRHGVPVRSVHIRCCRLSVHEDVRMMVLHAAGLC